MPRNIEDVMKKVSSANKNNFNYDDWLDHEDIQCLLSEINHQQKIIEKLEGRLTLLELSL